MLTSLCLDYVGHPVNKSDFYSHQMAHQLEPDDKICCERASKS